MENIMNFNDKTTNTQTIFCNIENSSITQSWQITIRDDEDSVINICSNMREFHTTMEELNDRNLLEIHWSKDSNVSEKHFSEIRLYMDGFKNELDNTKDSN